MPRINEWDKANTKHSGEKKILAVMYGKNKGLEKRMKREQEKACNLIYLYLFNYSIVEAHPPLATLNLYIGSVASDHPA